MIAAWQDMHRGRHHGATAVNKHVIDGQQRELAARSPGGDEPIAHLGRGVGIAEPKQLAKMRVIGRCVEVTGQHAREVGGGRQDRQVLPPARDVASRGRRLGWLSVHADQLDG